MNGAAAVIGIALFCLGLVAASWLKISYDEGIKILRTNFHKWAQHDELTEVAVKAAKLSSKEQWRVLWTMYCAGHRIQPPTVQPVAAGAKVTPPASPPKAKKKGVLAISRGELDKLLLNAA